MIRVLVADDQKLVRKGWRAVLARAPDIQVVGEARSGKEAVELALKLLPDVILMDVNMPEMDGLEATARIHKWNDKIGILMIDMTCEEMTVRWALENGAKGYITMHEFVTGLIPGVRAVREGKCYLSPSVAAVVRERRNGQPPGQTKAS